MPRTYVEDCAKMASELIDMESRGYGDTDASMHRISRRHHLPHGLLWSLRYRTPKTLPWDFVENLKAAYAQACRAQAAKLIRQADRLGATSGLDTDRLREVRALAARHLGEAQSDKETSA